MTFADIQKKLVESAKGPLPAKLGSIYAGVVLICLECRLSSDDDDEFTCAMSSDVVSQLELCRA